MKQVGLRDLKNRLSEYVRMVRSGEHVQVTDRGQVGAELLPPGPPKGRDLAAGLADLERRGLLRPPTAEGRIHYARLPRLLPTGTARRLLDEDRGER
jgi:antitoxin (DNA-binding transcriptional repressor) of toxin-antitoxin stability system